MQLFSIRYFSDFHPFFAVFISRGSIYNAQDDGDFEDEAYEDDDDAFEEQNDDDDDDDEYDSDGFDSRPSTAVTLNSDGKSGNKRKMPSLHFAVLGDKGIGKTSFVLASTNSLSTDKPVPKTCPVQELPVDLPNMTVKVTLHDAKADGQDNLSEVAMELKNIHGYFVCYSIEVRGLSCECDWID